MKLIFAYGVLLAVTCVDYAHGEAVKGQRRIQGRGRGRGNEKEKGRGNEKEKGRGNEKEKGRGNEKEKGKGNESGKGKGNEKEKGSGKGKGNGKGNGSLKKKKYNREDSGGIPVAANPSCPGSLLNEDPPPTVSDVNPRNIVNKGDSKTVSITGFDDFTFPTSFRPINGASSGGQFWFGRAGQGLFHLDEGVDFADGINSLNTLTASGSERANPRAVSNAFNQAADEFVFNPDGLSDWFWQWGQFMDHDLTEVPVHGSIGDDGEFDLSVPVPDDDPVFTDFEQVMLTRSEAEEVEEGAALEPLNEITGLIDANTVYGNTEARLAELLADDALGRQGTGRLATGEFNLLPFNVNGFCNADGGSSDGGSFFLAGDIRVNEQVNLITIHTLWMREHNFWADLIRSSDSRLTGAEVFEMARVIVQGEIQNIHLNEFLPILIGSENISPYTGYDPTVRPDAENIAASCAYRIGHTFISNQHLRVTDDGRSDFLFLKNAFFQPQEITDFGGLNAYMRGLATQTCQAADPLFAFALRNELTNGQDDLMMRNIIRARDHGLPTLNVLREAAGLPKWESFDDFAEPWGDRLAGLYEDVDDVDCFIGGSAEVKVGSGQLGSSFTTFLARNWVNIRDGDEFWYANQLSGALLEQIESTTLADVIMRNADTPGSLVIDGSAYFATDVEKTFPAKTKIIEQSKVAEIA